MSDLALRQEAFLLAVRDEDAPLPDGLGDGEARGLSIYRSNYRTSLIEALRSAFERTERLVGEGPFLQAAAHHCITHPPSAWTLDLAGQGFPATCAELFANDPDVAELASLEWAMHEAFTAGDGTALDHAGFAARSADFAEEDWERVRLVLLPHVRITETRNDLIRLWSSLAGEMPAAELVPLETLHSAIVWREGERPVFVIRPLWEGRALLQARQGASFGTICAQLAVELGEKAALSEAGAMLARWIGEGLVEHIVQ